MNNKVMPPEKACIHTAFERVASNHPDKLALKYMENSLSYQQLDLRANYLANYLRNNGAGYGDVIALSMSRSIEMIVSMLAILKCGAAYLPLDPNDPVPRKLMYLNEAEVNIIFSDSNCVELCENVRINLTTEDEHLFSSSMGKKSYSESKPEDVAYIMFTSGSTGKPKGVIVPHRAVTRLVIDTNYIDIDDTDSILQISPASFDASTFEIWGALLNAATLVLYSGTVLDPNLVKREIDQNEVTIIWLTAALFHLIADRYISAIKTIKVLLAGGDVLNPKFINKVLDTVPGITIINGYGPTENTTFTCCHRMTVENRPVSSVPIGKAISGTEVYVLNENLQPVSKGEIGELFTSGKGVALGYLNDSSNNNPFFYNENISEGLIYRTGDLVSENELGELEFIGRRDNQVKVRGYRVSLEEIENHIRDIEYVSDAAVVPKKYEAGDQILVAYVQIQEGQNLSASNIKQLLANVLPKYVIPNEFIINSNLPITRNGKIDKNAIASALNYK